MTSCAGHLDGMKKKMIGNNLSIPLQTSETFQEGSGWPFATADVKTLIFWAAYLVPDLFNCKHKPFISTILLNTDRLLTYTGHIAMDAKNKFTP